MTATNQPISVNSSVFSISVTATASTSAALPFKASTIRIVNLGANPAYISVGQGAQTATVPGATATQTSTPVLQGSDVGFSMDPTQIQNISAICGATLTTTLAIQIGDGT